MVSHVNQSVSFECHNIYIYYIVLLAVALSSLTIVASSLYVRLQLSVSQYKNSCDNYIYCQMDVTEWSNYRSIHSYLPTIQIFV